MAVKTAEREGKVKKRILAAIMTVSIMAVSVMGCGSTGEKASEADFKPSQTINWTVTSSPGGGSDIYTRFIGDLMTKNALVDQTIVITNLTDGAGEVGRLKVATAKNGDHELLTFNNGDLMPMVLNTENRIENFTPIAILARDSRLFFFGEHTKFADMKELLEAAKSGEHVVLGGSKGDDIETHQKLLEVTGLTSDQISYITYDSTGDAITALLGGHVDFCMSKPAAASEYVEAGSMIPVLSIALERYEGRFAEVPIISELGEYEDFEVPAWRGVVGPKSMSEAAVKYWSDVFKKVSESEEWKKDYLEKNMLTDAYMPYEEAAEFMKAYQEEVLAGK